MVAGKKQRLKSNKVLGTSVSEASFSEKESSRKGAEFSFGTFFKRYWKVILPIFLVFVLLFYSWNLRLASLDLSGIDSNVEANIYANVRNIIAEQIDSEYPNLNPAYKEEEVKKQYDQVLASGVINLGGQTYKISDIVAQNTQSIKDSFKFDDGQTYLNDIDTYYFFRKAENVLRTGTEGDEVVNGTAFETKTLAPNPFPALQKPGFHPWVESKFMKFYGVTPESSDSAKMNAIFLVAVVFATLSAIPAFFIMRKYTSDIFAFFGSLVLLSVGTFVSRTMAGFVDTDAYNVFFPLCVVLFAILAVEASRLWSKVVLSVVAGIFMGIFIWAWGPGWFIFVFIVASLVFYFVCDLVYDLVRKKSLSKDSVFVSLAVVFVSFLISSLIFVKLFAGVNIVSLVFEGIRGSFSDIAFVSTSNIWPNVLSSVAELNPASFGQIVGAVGGKIIFLIALIGLLFMAFDFKKDKFKGAMVGFYVLSIVFFIAVVNNNFLVSLTANHGFLFLFLLFLPVLVGIVMNVVFARDSVLGKRMFILGLLSVWVAGTIYMSFNGVRFILLLAPAFAVAFAIGLYYLARIVNLAIASEFNVGEGIGRVVVGVVVVSIAFGFLFVPMYKSAYAITSTAVPNFDDAWYEAMYKVKNESASDAIITSWWDFGHFFTSIADRGVTFDGGSQTTPAAHWVGRLLMENDEEVAHDILQMLVCGNNRAFEVMMGFAGEGADNADAVKVNRVISSTFGKSQVEKRSILKGNKYYSFSDAQVEEIMEVLACEDPRESYFVTSKDMIGKAGVWAHWGSWDFSKKYVYDSYSSKTPEQIAEEIDLNVSVVSKWVEELRAVDVKASSENLNREDLINSWLANYPSYLPLQNRYSYSCSVSGLVLSCQNSIKFDMNSSKITDEFKGQVTYRRVLLPSIFGDLHVVNVSESGAFDVLFLPSGDGKFEVMLMQYPLGGSLFTKLYFMNGFGTSQFELFDAREGGSGNRVIVWKTNWSGINENVSKKLDLSDLFKGELNLTEGSSNVSANSSN